MRARYAGERSIAPNVDPQWVETFIVALRLRGVAGEQISDALVEVNDYIAESGRTAEEAFGPASQYAVSLGLPCADDNTTSALYRSVVPSIFGMLGCSAASAAVSSWHSGTLVSATVGDALFWALAVVVTLLLPLVSRVLPKTPLADRTRKGMLLTVGMGSLIGVGLMILVSVPVIVFKAQLVQLPGSPVFCLGIVFLAVSTVLYLRLPYRDDSLEPPLARSTAQRPHSRSRWLLAFMFPAATLLSSLPCLFF